MLRYAYMIARDIPLNSQKAPHVLVDAFRKQLELLSTSTTWDSPFMGLNLSRRFAIWRNGRLMEKYLGRVLDERLSSIDIEAAGTKSKPRSILDMALERYLAEQPEPKSKGAVRMDAWARKSTIDQ